MKSSSGRNQPSGWSILVAIDFAAAALAGIILAGGRMNGSDLFTDLQPVLVALGIGVAFVTVLAACGLYQAASWFTTTRLAGRSVLAMLILTLGSVLAARLAWSGPAGPQLAFWIIPALYVALVATLRFAMAAALSQGLVRPRLAWTQGGGGAGASYDGVGAMAGMGPRGGTLALREDDAQGARLAVKELQRNGINAAVATDPGAVAPALRRACNSAGVRVLSAQEFSELQRGRVDLATLPADWLETAALAHESPFAAAVRRGFDVFASLVLLLLTLPLLLLTALAIRLEGPGPIFYRQERVGLNGRVFRLFKFRSMSIDAEKGGPRWAVVGDPRVTRVGRIIRLTRIDEIPQAINVLRGDMAMIGPRPERPNFVEHLSAVIPHYDSRSAVRPGITGWAQINYPYGASVEDARNKLSYDLYYLRHRSLGLDAAIIFGTIRVILLQEGAR